jgi:hypothetical protein
MSNFVCKPALGATRKQHSSLVWQASRVPVLSAFAASNLLDVSKPLTLGLLKWECATLLVNSQTTLNFSVILKLCCRLRERHIGCAESLLVLLADVRITTIARLITLASARALA